MTRPLTSFDLDCHPNRGKGRKRSVSIRGEKPAALCLVPAEKLTEIFDEAEKDNDRRAGDANQEQGFETVHERHEKMNHNLNFRPAGDKSL